MPETADIETLFAVADRAADRAGEILLDYFGAVKVEYKGEIDLVTEADRTAEEAIISLIRESFPDHGIYAEESGVHEGDKGAGPSVRWIIDPLDGTTNYAHGLPLFAVSIAVEVDGRLEVGVVCNPATDEKYTAKRGQGAALNGDPIHVSDVPVLNRSLLVTGFPYSVRETEHDNLDHFARFSKRGQGIRRLGSAALDLAYVARGSLDGYWETEMNAWDIAAGWLLVEEAGGKVTDFRNRPLDFALRQILATNGRIHDEMISVLALGKTGL